MTVIRPTHSCFDDAIVIVLALEAHELEYFRVVHALCAAPRDAADDDRAPYAHAWVEQSEGPCGAACVWQGCVIDGERMHFALRPEDFHATHEIIRATRYTPQLVIAMLRQHDTSGPWRAEYRVVSEQARRDGAPRVWDTGVRCVPLSIGKFGR